MARKSLEAAVSLAEEGQRSKLGIMMLRGKRHEKSGVATCRAILGDYKKFD